MFKITGLKSWNLNADKFGDTVRFYQEQLGLKEGFRHEVLGAEVVRVRTGDTGLGIFDASRGPRPGVPHHTFGFEGPDDPEQAKKELAERGIQVLEVRRHQGGEGKGYSLYVNDPSGNRIELSRSAR